MYVFIWPPGFRVLNIAQGFFEKFTCLEEKKSGEFVNLDKIGHVYSTRWYASSTYVCSRQSKLKNLKIPTHGCEPEQHRSISKIFRPLVVYVRREYVSVVERQEREDSPRPWANTMSERSDTWVQLVPDVRRVGAVGGVGVWFVLMFRMFLPQGHCVYYHSVTSKQLLIFWFVMKY